MGMKPVLLNRDMHSLVSDLVSNYHRNTTWTTNKLFVCSTSYLTVNAVNVQRINLTILIRRMLNSAAILVYSTAHGQSRGINMNAALRPRQRKQWTVTDRQYCDGKLTGFLHFTFINTLQLTLLGEQMWTQLWSRLDYAVKNKKKKDQLLMSGAVRMQTGKHVYCIAFQCGMAIQWLIVSLFSWLGDITLACQVRHGSHFSDATTVLADGTSRTGWDAGPQERPLVPLNQSQSELFSAPQHAGHTAGWAHQILYITQQSPPRRWLSHSSRKLHRSE